MIDYTFLLIVLVLLAVYWGTQHILRDDVSERMIGYKYIKRSSFMSPHEVNCYIALNNVVGGKYYIFPQVSLSTLFDPSSKARSWRGSRSHIDRKSVDFVLCDKNDMTSLLAIELDDSSHLLPKRIRRDIEVERIFKESNMPLLRILDTANLAERIQKKITEPNEF